MLLKATLAKNNLKTDFSLETIRINKTGMSLTDKPKVVLAPLNFPVNFFERMKIINHHSLYQFR